MRSVAGALLRRGQSRGEMSGGTVHAILAVGASCLLLMGWLLPWFVGPFSGGVGYSPQDVVSSSPTGVASLMAYVLGVLMVVLVASPAVDLVARLTHRDLGRRADAVRGIAALVGLALAVGLWLLAGVVKEEAAFGRLPVGAYADSAVWLTMYGYGLAAIVYGARRWIVANPTPAFIAAALPLGILLPPMFHQAPDFVLWAAESLAVYMLLALGLNVVVGFAGLLDLGYAAFFAIGAYACASFASPIHGFHLPIWVLIFLGASIASLFGAILGAPTLRLRGDYLAIVTLGFGEIVPDLATNNVFNLTGGANGLSGIDQPTVGPADFGTNPRYYYWSLLFLCIVVVVLLRNLERSRVGRAWVALREDEVAAAATGINTVSTKLLAFAIGASVSGLAGAFYGSIVTTVNAEDFSFSVSIAVLSIIVLGGIGNIVGVIVGAFVLTFVIFWALPHMNEWSTTVSTTFNVSALNDINFTQYTYVIYGASLILMMLLRPGGLLPSRARRIEIESGVATESLSAVQGRA
ncbi:MAG TPA: branched-chain amino acid ABC transporter permease [Candidatus Dormibacteraeota bacterium]|nr:branched-chain amino acid ABC transporter permease [Candidatus Dormibacteraeota bacterium]